MDLDLARSLKDRLRSAVDSTLTNSVLRSFGSFGGAIQIPADHDQPVVVVSIDGVGTKLHLAIEWGEPAVAGRDLVNHCLNDVAVEGAHPIAFLDYVAAGILDPEVVEALVSGMAAACRDSAVALIGGETAQMPDTYRAGAYDAVGVALGVVAHPEMSGHQEVSEGDVCIGLPSTGLHTNGYSLARRVAAKNEAATPVGGQTLQQALLAPHRSYVAELRSAFSIPGVRTAAHITGGGLPGNISRVIPDSLTARLTPSAWSTPPVFAFIQEDLQIPESDMYEVFNMGVGLAVIAEPEAAEHLLGNLPEAFLAGEIVPRRYEAVELVRE